MLLADKQIWWQAPDSERIPLGILLAIVWYFPLRSVASDVKNAPKRSPKVRRIEVRVAIALWTFILLAVTVIFIVHR